MCGAGSDGTAGLSSFSCSKASGSQCVPRFSFSDPGSLRREPSVPRSNPEHPHDPDSSEHPFVCRAGPLGSGIDQSGTYDEGMFGCFRMPRINRIAPGIA